MDSCAELKNVPFSGITGRFRGRCRKAKLGVCACTLQLVTAFEFFARSEDAVSCPSEFRLSNGTGFDMHTL